MEPWSLALSLLSLQSFLSLIVQGTPVHPGSLSPHSFIYPFIHTMCSVQFSSVAQLCPTLCDPMDCSMPGLPVHHQLLEFTQTHVHWVGDAIQPSHPLSSPSSPAFNLSQHQGLSNGSALCVRWPKCFSFNISPSNEYSGLISFRMDMCTFCQLLLWIWKNLSNSTFQQSPSTSLHHSYDCLCTSQHYLKNNNNIYLAAPGLSCSIWNLSL